MPRLDSAQLGLDAHPARTFLTYVRKMWVSCPLSYTICHDYYCTVSEIVRRITNGFEPYLVSLGAIAASGHIDSFFAENDYADRNKYGLEARSCPSSTIYD